MYLRVSELNKSYERTPSSRILKRVNRRRVSSPLDREQIRTARLTSRQRQGSVRVAFTTAKSGGATSLEGAETLALYPISSPRFVQIETYLKL
jgi:hypothetical protein